MPQKQVCKLCGSYQFKTNARGQCLCVECGELVDDEVLAAKQTLEQKKEQQEASQKRGREETQIRLLEEISKNLLWIRGFIFWYFIGLPILILILWFVIFLVTRK